MSTTHATHTMQLAMRPAARVAEVAVNFIRAWKNRREFYRLGEMSDAELADIGLVRADLNVVVDLPFGKDPTTYLGAFAEARRLEIETMARQVS